MADHHRIAQSLVLVDGVDLPVSGSHHRRAFFRSQVDAVVDPPVPGGLVVAQSLHGVSGDGFPGYGRNGLQHLLLRGSGNRLPGCAAGFLRSTGLGGGLRGRLGLGGDHRHILRAQGAHQHILIGLLQGNRLRRVGVPVVYIARDSDCRSAQNQGYVVALAAAEQFAFVAHK